MIDLTNEIDLTELSSLNISTTDSIFNLTKETVELLPRVRTDEIYLMYMAIDTFEEKENLKRASDYNKLLGALFDFFDNISTIDEFIMFCDTKKWESVIKKLESSLKETIPETNGMNNKIFYNMAIMNLKARLDQIANMDSYEAEINHTYVTDTDISTFSQLTRVHVSMTLETLLMKLLRTSIEEGGSMKNDKWTLKGYRKNYMAVNTDYYVYDDIVSCSFDNGKIFNLKESVPGISMLEMSELYDDYFVKHKKLVFDLICDKSNI